MTFDEYQNKAERTMNRGLSGQETILHAVLGAASEAGELAGILQKSYQGHPITVEDIVEEVGDCLWFLSEICEAFGFRLEYAAKHNIRKLELRYSGDGFSSDDSIRRVDHCNVD